jgi:hypothetical protein
MNLDQTNEAQAKRERLAETRRVRNAAKSAKARQQPGERIDPERLMKAIQYLKEH